MRMALQQAFHQLGIADSRKGQQPKEQVFTLRVEDRVTYRGGYTDSEFYLGQPSGVLMFQRTNCRSNFPLQNGSAGNPACLCDESDKLRIAGGKTRIMAKRTDSISENMLRLFAVTLCKIDRDVRHGAIRVLAGRAQIHCQTLKFFEVGPPLSVPYYIDNAWNAERARVFWVLTGFQHILLAIQPERRIRVIHGQHAECVLLPWDPRLGFCHLSRQIERLSGPSIRTRGVERCRDIGGSKNDVGALLDIKLLC